MPLSKNRFTGKFILSALATALVVFSAARVKAEELRDRSIRELIMRLERDYSGFKEELDKLEKEIKNYPSTRITVTVVKRDPNLKLLSVELVDNERLTKSHIYSQLEAETLNAGGRHLLYSGEAGEGGHTLKAIYYWKVEGGQPKKGESFIKISIRPSKEYHVEFALEKHEAGARLQPTVLEFAAQ